MEPAGSIVNPCGNEPDDTDQVLPPVPPVAASGAEYAAPTVPFGSAVVVIVRAAGFTARVSAFVAVALLLSFTWTVKLAFAAPFGVPVIAPLALSVNPAGSDPETTDQVLPPVPPVAVSVCE